MQRKPVASQKDPESNRLLAALSAADYDCLWPEMEFVRLPVGTVIHEANTEMAYVYFPLDCIVALLNFTRDGASAEIAMSGREGLVGLALLMGGDTTLSRAVVQSAGDAVRVRATFLKHLFDQRPSLQHLVLRYAQARMVQIGQTAVCNRHHSLDQQLTRWLLLSLDRSPSNQLTVTQEVIASNLGVRREGVTHAACELRKAGLIRYHRGHITVLNRSLLEARSCECYTVIRHEYERLLPDSFASASRVSSPVQLNAGGRFPPMSVGLSRHN